MVEHNLAKVGVAGSTPVSRSILLLTIFFLSLFAQESNISQSSKTLSLKSRYEVPDSCVSPALFGLKTRKTACLFDLGNRTRLTVPVYRVVEKLRALEPSLRIAPPSRADILFELRPRLRFPHCEKALSDAYRKTYPTLSIRALRIEPNDRKRGYEVEESQCRLKLTPSNLRRDHGTFVAVCGRKHHFFRYRLEGDIAVYKAVHQIKKDRMLSSESLRRVVVPFEKFADTPVTSVGEGRYIARQNIAAGKVVTRRMVAPVPEVRKGDRVRCRYDDGPVHIEFEAVALKNGYEGESVTLRKSDGTTLRGVVKGPKEVEIR